MQRRDAIQILSSAALASQTLISLADDAPLRLAIVGLVHGHVGGFLRQAVEDKAIELVGVFDPTQALREQYAGRYGFDSKHLFGNLDAMLDRAKPEAVALMTSTFDHTEVVEKCAARGVHVMMEKPLAVNIEHGARIERAAKRNGIHVLVNYETTWYSSHHALKAKVEDGAIGELRKFVVRDGHPGPKEIGCSDEFLNWLTDPVWNGAGALYDFGCYGANLATWLLNNQRPVSVTAITQQIKPNVYPNVDDEATIILEYPKAVAILQASWNWPYNRKDMDVYGTNGSIKALNNDNALIKIGGEKENPLATKALAAPHHNPLAYFKAVVRGAVKPGGLSSLQNNLIVNEILDAARRSAKTSEKVLLA
ncbi:MAG: Gfo/Idh/MocA family oxidoreductase [Candidatus Hinthialibacter antarcticus]|nr:Gfo/Idh/MocA family oxidoreductase [Candidatus Hinthialibacter antarcticus]